MNNFNFIAPFYDTISKLVFGNSLIESQTFFLSEIKEIDTVLILGGGTGKLLDALPRCKQIHFLDLSERMIVRAKKRESNSPVNFIHADFLDHDFVSTYDVIICPFFLDCFDENDLRKVLGKAKFILNQQGRLIVTDFQRINNNRFLLKLMHVFFRICASLQSKNLKDIHQEAKLVGFKLVTEKFFQRNRIFSRLYRNL